jgi:hypothetical protein
MQTTSNAANTHAASTPALKFRVMEFGVTSYWPKTFDAAKEIAEVVMARNGCGLIQERMNTGLWNTTHRYEPWYGLVVNTAEFMH